MIYLKNVAPDFQLFYKTFQNFSITIQHYGIIKQVNIFATFSVFSVKLGKYL